MCLASPTVNGNANTAKRLRGQGIDSASLSGRYDNPVPTRFLAPIDCSKIPSLDFGSVGKCTEK
jgi:hypothetical protein